MKTIREVDPWKYHIPKTGLPILHRNMTWYATDDDRVLGAVVLDLADNDFGWVVLTQNDQGPGYTAVDLGTSLPTQQLATENLHAAMLVEAGGSDAAEI